MEKDLESWLHQQQLNEQFPNARSSKLPPYDIGIQNSFARATPCAVAASTNIALPGFGLSGLPNIKPLESKEPQGLFYCWPHSRQGLLPETTLLDSFIPETNLFGKSNTPAVGRGPASKQFLVFDQTGNKTTMMFSSGIGTSIPRPATWTRKPAYFYKFNDDEHRIRSDGHDSEPNLTDDLDDDHGSIVGSDMREDSEEIDALLYSDEEDNYSEDAEETSTGHSPSTMTAYEKHDWSDEEDMDEVASSTGPVKRQKLSESDYQIPSITYTASCAKPNHSSDYEEDAESSCAGSKPTPFNDMGSSLGNKQARREKIRETVSILQTILPNAKGKDAVTVLDEAINYLKTLKFNATSLGLSRGE
ncbi:hypothetical protein RND81_01G220500 [Saponaria officinalis]|uniref:BHLH domain-containing protein n=1 Tax=Saponaria officinalis TaxID=3572 RepID=A0AAW1NH96_SAPOF